MCSCYSPFSFFFPIFLLPAAFIGFFYYILAIGYLKTGRDLRRMESNSRSPIFSGFGELLEGIVTVRAFSAEQRFLDDLHSKIDVTTKVTPRCAECMMMLTGVVVDVVQFLDDEPLALVEL
jgi:ABC-type multidrug transport system fused ATPase/permease subunit